MMEDLASIVAIPDEHDRSPDPGEDIIEAYWDILGVCFVKDPNFARGCWFGDTMTIVVYKTAIISRIFAKTKQSFFELFCVYIGVSFELDSRMCGG